MENIEGISLKKLPFELNKRGDLIAFDSPYLSYFYNENGDGYFLNWLDSDDIVNRWLLFEVKQIDLFDYFTGKKSLLNLINDGEEIVFIIDIDDNVNFKHITLSKKSNLPSNYLPEKDSFYEEIIATGYAKSLRKEILDTFSIYNIKSIRTKVKHFNNHLDDLDFVTILNNRDIKNSLEDLSRLRSSYMPLLILNHFWEESHDDRLKYLLHKYHSAHTNPFEYKSYFIELDGLLPTNIHNKLDSQQIREANLYTAVVDRLNSVAIAFVSQDPAKYKQVINLWRQQNENDNGNESLNKTLGEFLME